MVAGLLVLFVPLGVWLGWERWAFGLLLAWAFSLLLGALSLRTRSRRLVLGVAYVIALFSGFCATALGTMHGPNGPGFGLLLALPLGVMALAPSIPLAAVLVGVGTLLGGVVQIIRFGAGTQFAVIWVSISMALTVVAVVGTRGFRLVWLSELRAQHDKALMLEQLAESERRRGQVERLALVGRLSSAVGHELNNPLAVVVAGLSYLKGARGRLETEDEVGEVLDEMEQAARRMAHTVGAMKALAQGGSAELEAIPAGELIEAAWERATGALSTVKAERPPLEGLPTVLGLAPFLESALEALLVNAAEAARQSPGGQVRLMARPEGDELHLIVEDDGPGLSAEVQQRLFEPFFTTKGPSRSGLGLAVAREQVLRCGGSLEGSGRPEGGARFTLRLRLAIQ